MTELTRSLIIIPTYNEAGNLEPLVSAVLALDAGFELLVVDDNSPDGTGEIADRLSEKLASVHVLHRPGKMGLGTAYVEGFDWAIATRYDYVLEMDCDSSHNPRCLPRFVKEIASADLVIGSRYVKGGSTPDWGLARRLISRSGNFFPNAAGIKDSRLHRWVSLLSSGAAPECVLGGDPVAGLWFSGGGGLFCRAPRMESD